MAELREQIAQAIREANGTPEALGRWERDPHLIPADLYADAAADVVEPVLYGWRQRALDGEAAIARARDIHQRRDDVDGRPPVCRECVDECEEPVVWPCATIRALNGEPTPGGAR